MMHELGRLDNLGGLEDDILISLPSRGNGASQLSSSLHMPRGLHLEDHGQYATTTAESFVARVDLLCVTLLNAGFRSMVQKTAI
ncbi:uncharacterized protein LOC144113193 isoform X2 [Amblyomma americanum]